jgi:hypothetical protein
MKKSISILTLLLGTLTLFAQQDKNETFPLEAMIAVVNNSLEKANERLSATSLDIKTAEITLKTSYDKSGGGGFKIFVKASKKWELEKANTMTFVYEKAEKINEKAVDFFDNKKVFEKNLTTAIVSAASQWQKTTATVKGLSKSKFSVEISFMVKDITDGGIEFEIWGVGLDIGGEYEKTAVHTVSLTFK